MPDTPAQFSLLLKPASFDCNLHCHYCFYLPKEEIYGKGVHRMSMETLDRVTRDFLSIPMDTHVFAWQGGEPTLMGMEFFQNAINRQKLYGKGRQIINSIQTNGTLLDDKWAAFLHENNFLVGISVDGPQKLHNCFRQHSDGRGTHAEVMNGLDALKRHKVDFNALTLVTAANQNAPAEIYQYLKQLGFEYHQYIECIDFAADGKPMPYAIKPGKWGEFLCRLFDEWYPNDVGKISIRLFDSILSRLGTGQPTICPMNGSCCNYLVLEHNGDIYPCDFNVRTQSRQGNIREAKLKDIFASPAYQAWGTNKKPADRKCFECRFLPLCMGDCPKNRINGISALCEDWKLFYSHTIERFEKILQ